MNNKKLSKNVFESLLMAIFIMIYFIIINFAYYKLEKTNLLLILKILSMVVLSISIMFFEIAYRSDSGKRAANAIEILILAGHTLSIAHIVEVQRLSFTNYILVSAYLFSIYFLLKAICIHTKEEKDYLNSLSDIKEIVNNEPIKKTATKKSEKVK